MPLDQQQPQNVGLGQRQPQQVGRSMPRPFEAMGEGTDNETAQKFRAKGPLLSLTAAQKLDFGFDPSHSVRLLLLGTRHARFQDIVKGAAKSNFKLMTKEVPFGDFKKVMRVFAVKRPEKEEGGLRA